MIEDRRRERLRWQCRRGMLELDLILSSVFERYYDRFTESERDMFEQFLELEDATLRSYLQGDENPRDPELMQFVKKLRQ